MRCSRPALAYCSIDRWGRSAVVNGGGRGARGAETPSVGCRGGGSHPLSLWGFIDPHALPPRSNPGSSRCLGGPLALQRGGALAGDVWATLRCRFVQRRGGSCHGVDRRISGWPLLLYRVARIVTLEMTKDKIKINQICNQQYFSVFLIQN